MSHHELESLIHLRSTEITLCLYGVEDTWFYAEVLGRFILNHWKNIKNTIPPIIAAYGDLGSGKTSFAQGVARGLAVPEHDYVNSPTFAILQTHQGQLPFHHIDLYRLYNEEELIFLGLDEIIQDGIAYIEWPQRAPDFFKQPHICLQFSYDLDNLDQRILSISFSHIEVQSYQSILNKLYQCLYHSKESSSNQETNQET
jgi:tRNA threonylcarbamoyladenosine biosynthesis protein TsaE